MVDPCDAVRAFVLNVTNLYSSNMIRCYFSRLVLSTLLINVSCDVFCNYTVLKGEGGVPLHFVTVSVG